MTGYTDSEMMIRAAADELADGETVFVGIGLPMLACNLAKSTHAPELDLVYESGVIGAPISRGGVPTSIADPKLASGSACIYPMYEGFARFLQGGRIDAGFLGGAQIDRWGNINSTVIGSYDDPTVRFPGSGGACEIACNAQRVIAIAPHEARRFPEHVDFLTSPGHLGDRGGRESYSLTGGGPSAVITDKAVMRFDDTGEMYVDALHPTVSQEAVAEATGWDIPFADPLGETNPPTTEDIDLIRNILDPGRTYIEDPDD